MQDFQPQHLGRLLILIGIVITILGAIIVITNKLGLFDLPGDIKFTGKNTKIYFPIVSCIIISALLTLIMWIINYFRK